MVVDVDRVIDVRDRFAVKPNAVDLNRQLVQCVLVKPIQLGLSGLHYLVTTFDVVGRTIIHLFFEHVDITVQ